MNPWITGGIGFLLGRASKSCDCPRPHPQLDREAQTILDKWRREDVAKKEAEESTRRAAAAWARAKRMRERNATLAAVAEVSPPLNNRKSRRLCLHLALGIAVCVIAHGVGGDEAEVVLAFAFVFTVITGLRLFGADERQRTRDGERIFRSLSRYEQMARLKRHGWKSQCGM